MRPATSSEPSRKQHEAAQSSLTFLVCASISSPLRLMRKGPRGPRSLKRPRLLPHRVLCLVAESRLTLCDPQGAPRIMLFFLDGELSGQCVGLRKPTRLLPGDGLSPLSKDTQSRDSRLFRI